MERPKLKEYVGTYASQTDRQTDRLTDSQYTNHTKNKRSRAEMRDVLAA